MICAGPVRLVMSLAESRRSDVSSWVMARCRILPRLKAISIINGGCGVLGLSALLSLLDLSNNKQAVGRKGMACC